MPKTCLDSSRDQFSFKNQPQSNPRLRPLIVAEGAPGSICFLTLPGFGNSSAIFSLLSCPGMADFFILVPQILRTGNIFFRKSVFFNCFLLNHIPLPWDIGGSEGSQWGSWGGVGSWGADFFKLAPQIHHLTRILLPFGVFGRFFSHSQVPLPEPLGLRLVPPCCPREDLP